MTRIALIAVLALLLAGCDSLNPFSSNDKTPLPGERISVMTGTPDLKPDPAISDVKVVLPPPEVNKGWPQSGGRPSHAMGHLALADKPARAWSTSIGAGSDSDKRLMTQPVVANGVVYTMDTDFEVRAFNAQNGSQMWSTAVAKDEDDAEGAMGGGLAYAEDRLFVTTGFAKIVALDASNGKEIWRESVFAPMHAAPTVADGRVYTVTLDNRTNVFSASDGRPLWQHTGLQEVADILGAASPAVADGIVVVPHTSGELFALSADAGRVRWSDSLAAIRRVDAVSQLPDIRGDPVIDDGLVFATSHSGRMAALDLRTSRRVWDREIGGIQTPWTAGKYLYVINSNSLLICMMKENGRIRWTAQLPRWEDPDEKETPVVWSGPVLAGDRLIIAGSNEQALSVSPYTGKTIGRIDLPGKVFIAPIVADKTVYFLTDDGELVAYR